MATIEDFPGKTLSGGYKIGRPIGKGNFAWVYEGAGPDGGKVAVKVLHRRDVQAERRFHREIKVLREIPATGHCVAHVADGVTPDGTPWFAMEYVHGVTLSHILAKGKPISGRELLRLMVELCKGFAGLHKLGLAHRDVKPDNIMITHPGGHVKLLDFGLVQDSQGLLKLFEDEDILEGHDFGDDLDHGILAGTPEYMAPEQISDPKNADPTARRTDTTADVYSLGVIFYQLLTGRKLFPFTPSSTDPRGTHEEVMQYLDERLAFTDDDLVRPSNVDGELWSILRKALRREPKARQGSALQLAGDLEIYARTGRGIPPDEDIRPTVRGLPGIPPEVLEQIRGQGQGGSELVIPESPTVEQTRPSALDRLMDGDDPPDEAEARPMQQAPEAIVSAAPPGPADVVQVPAAERNVWPWVLLGLVLVGGGVVAVLVVTGVI